MTRVRKLLGPAAAAVVAAAAFAADPEFKASAVIAAYSYERESVERNRLLLKAPDGSVVSAKIVSPREAEDRARLSVRRGGAGLS